MRAPLEIGDHRRLRVTLRPDGTADAVLWCGRTLENVFAARTMEAAVDQAVSWASAVLGLEDEPT